MPHRPGVSIIVDSYNHERFVAAAIRSALAQDHEPLQVIVIDDGSPDRSRAIIEGFGGAITSIFQENQGQVAACRNALAHAEHDIVIFLDSDDLLEPHAARTVAGHWRAGVSKVQYCLHIVDDQDRRTGTVFPTYPASLTPEVVRAEMLRAGSYPDSPTSGNAYDRRFLQRAMPLLPRRNGLDGELNGIAPLHGDVVSLDRPLGSYRIHGENSFAQDRLNVGRFADYLRHSEARLAFIREHYRSMGQEIAADALDHDLKYQEYALVVEKLGEPARRGRRAPMKAAGRAIGAALRSPHAPLQRALRAGWIAAVALAPASLAAWLVEQRFIPGRRQGWITGFLAMHRPPAPKRGSPPPVARGLPRQHPSSSHV